MEFQIWRKMAMPDSWVRFHQVGIYLPNLKQGVAVSWSAPHSHGLDGLQPTFDALEKSSKPPLTMSCSGRYRPARCRRRRRLTPEALKHSVFRAEPEEAPWPAGGREPCRSFKRRPGHGV